MADNEQADGGAEAAEIAPAPKGKLKLIIAIVGMLIIVGGGATWFFFFRNHGDETHAAVVETKPPVFVEIPDMLVNLAGGSGQRAQYLEVRLDLRREEEK